MVRIDLKAIMAIFAVIIMGVLGGCAASDSDIPAPVVILTSPANQATGVLLTEPISVAFSKVMQSDAFTSTNFTVTPSGGAAVSGNITYANGYATLTPAVPMLPSTLYTATIAAGVQASDGSALVASYSWSFTTGPLNAGFGSGGVVTTPVSATLGDGARAVAVQPLDGKIVAVGYVDSGGGNYDFAIVRYNTDGSLDAGFGVNGIVVTAVSASADEARAVVIQPGGKIVVAGVAYNGADTDFAVVRYGTNGNLDTAFGNGGIVITDFGTNSNDEAFAVAVYPATGEIVVVGQTGSLVASDFALARYTAGGALDTRFDTDGMQTTSFGEGVDAAYSVAIQGDGKIVVAGITDSTPGTEINNDFALARYDGTTGALDAAFGNSGKVTTNVAGANEGAFAVGIQSGGKIVAAGVVFNGANNDFGLVRYNALDGTLDTTFGVAGTVITDMAGGNDAALALMIQIDGKIVVAGTAFVTNQANDFATARYTADGVLDTTFDTDGKVITNISALSDAAFGVAQSVGNIVLAGSSGTGASANFVLVGFAP